ncbi:3-phosphoshikimate 1-carboxyvinyltransferase [Sphingomonas sp. LY29]|uniref:3-phosphoshikimate 1-carboxyvinyltransferase n=1 Tax=Sphingomonas sp. LY29 TaxID=3095341 RepID=UPI002D797778|nr:3-phosphoshikimate 1-carboxyvinyltransferase [Sphingomonas sp. LY29]WRP25159.1 3-phosphoshikimate 1-carboxyvinyltransferase [Sphingomonas sp. LY29]
MTDPPGSPERLIARPGASLVGEAAIPGDKSCSHRALILGAMASGITRIEGLLESDDVLATVRALEAFGIVIDRDGPGRWRVEGGAWRSPVAPIDCGNSGTAARLLIGAVAGMPGVSATFTGDTSLNRRPMRRLVAPLRRMGATIDGDDRLALPVHGARLGGIDFANVPASAQVKSAILLAGLGTTAPVRVTEPLVSRDHSEIMLGQFGVDVLVDDGVVTLADRRDLAACALSIASDPSSAAFPLVAAAIVPGSAVTARDMLVNPHRTGLYEVLERMGADIRLSNETIRSGEVVADVEVRHSDLRGCDVSAAEVVSMIDEIPALAVACAMADGESMIEGLGELRHKESDRLGAIVAGLAAAGVVSIPDGDALRIFGRGQVRGGADVVTHGDHRIAMAFLTLGLASQQPIAVDGAEMIATSFPNFVEVMNGLGADIGEAA